MFFYVIYFWKEVLTNLNFFNRESLSEVVWTMPVQHRSVAVWVVLNFCMSAERIDHRQTITWPQALNKTIPVEATCCCRLKKIICRILLLQDSSLSSWSIRIFLLWFNTFLAILDSIFIFLMPRYESLEGERRPFCTHTFGHKIHCLQTKEN